MQEQAGKSIPDQSCLCPRLWKEALPELCNNDFCFHAFALLLIIFKGSLIKLTFRKHVLPLWRALNHYKVCLRSDRTLHGGDTGVAKGVAAWPRLLSGWKDDTGLPKQHKAAPGRCHLGRGVFLDRYRIFTDWILSRWADVTCWEEIPMHCLELASIHMDISTSLPMGRGNCSLQSCLGKSPRAMQPTYWMSV